MKNLAFIIPPILLFIIAAGCVSKEKTSSNPLPDISLYDRADLEKVRKMAKQRVDPFFTAVDSLKMAADRAMVQESFSVMQKKMLPPSGDKHDYYSMGPYWWPDPDSPDGLPYVRHDGVVNPEYNNYDNRALHQMAKAVSTLSLAWFYTGHEPYAEQSMELLRTWFLDPGTRMNPHLEFGQAIPGRTEGRGIGIIETGSLLQVVNAIGMLKGAEAMKEEDHQGLKAWFNQYTHWLISSKNGWDERMYFNNHGTSYDSQVATFAIFTGLDSVAKMILDSVGIKRISRQIEPDGSQPFELRRTKAMSYSIKNLRHLIENAVLAEHFGIDLWHYESEKGGSIRLAIEYLVPFYTAEKEFSYQQIGGMESLAGDLYKLLLLAADNYDSEILKEALNAIPASPPDHDIFHLLNPVFE
ncbi:MAG: alginate lyase family protein [Bacteroidales bacterium]|nr:alginate lyase family protein [Bacteroidales bacterium]